MKTADSSHVVEVARDVAQRIAGPDAERVDRDAAWPEGALRALQTRGLGGLVVPAEYGGLGRGLLGLAQVCEELGRACASTSMCFGMHSVAAAVLSAKPTAVQVRDLVAPIVAGEHLTTLALSESNTGVHFYYPKCDCRADGEALRLCGSKSFVTNGGHADSYVVSVQRSDLEVAPTSGNFSCVAILRDDPGLRWDEPWEGLGLRGNSSRDLELSDVTVPRERLLGAEGDQLWYVFQVVAPYFLVAMAGTYIGVAQRALDRCCEHVAARQFGHTGRGLADEPVVQHRLGVLWAQVARSRSFLHDAAGRADLGEDVLPAILSVKAEVSEMVNEVIAGAMTLMGGRAYQARGELDRLMRDARAAHVMSPTTDLLRQWVGRALLDQPLLGS